MLFCLATPMTSKEENSCFCHESLAFFRVKYRNLYAARAFAFAASSSRFLDVRSSPAPELTSRDFGYFIDRGQECALVSLRRFVRPVIFRTNWSEAARISSAVTGGSKLKRVLMFLHTRCDLERLRDGHNLSGDSVFCDDCPLEGTGL